MRVLAIADEVSEALYGPTLKEIDPDLVVSCGDLPFEYLEYIVTVTNVPLVYVLGNHDPSLRRRDEPGSVWTPGYITESHHDEPGPQGCTSTEGRIVDEAGLRIAGLGGSLRYSEGPNQYTQGQMRKRAGKVRRAAARKRLFDRKPVDLVIAHSPPAGVGDREDGVHEGFDAFHGLVRALRPRYLIHGHVHTYGNTVPDHQLRTTTVINAVGHRVLEV
jgi:hypothetical protein